MKTPMQEHIEWLKSENKKYTEKAQEESSMQILGYAFKMRDCIKHAESMLEKEKEVIKNAYIEGCGDNILCESTDKKRAEEYYNETFNTNQENLPDSTNGYTYYPLEHKTVFNTKKK